VANPGFSRLIAPGIGPLGRRGGTAASGTPQPLGVGFEGLLVSADAGRADERFFEVSFGHILRQRQPLDWQGVSEFPESFND